VEIRAENIIKKKLIFDQINSGGTKIIKIAKQNQKNREKYTNFLFMDTF
jgi:hypothetical protein